ncbi:MAG TPA: Sir2 family NAD-dependent protein deacetylase [Planctomycetota bacterium]|nr:Sir2 family NAD-dependent protein deacetylase [Planctomycetota bacterium]
MIEFPASLVTALREAKSVGVITGAGISQGSGIPTYRGTSGIYEQDESGRDVMEALSGSTFRSDPNRTWAELLRLARTSLEAQPNAAHRALVCLEQAKQEFILLTQNVDGLHQRAGSRAIIDIHGDLRVTKCLSCGESGSLTAADALSLRAPRCTICGGAMRPAVVLFEEMLDERKLSRLQAAFFRRIPDVVLSIGTSSLFPYISEPVRIAAAMGHVTVEINPDDTELSALVRHHLQGPAEVLLPALMDACGFSDLESMQHPS